MADFEEIAKKAKDAVKNLVKKEPLSVISLNKEGENWLALVEVLERKAVPDTQSLIGVYELKFSRSHALLGYKRIEVRHKGDTGEEIKEEK